MTTEPPDGGLRRADGATIWYDVISAARRGSPWLVLCPPAGRNAAYWAPELLTELARAHTVVRLDWRGQGRSSWAHGAGVHGGDGGDRADPATTLVEDLLAVCRTVPTTAPLRLLGVGFGGWLALEAVRRLEAHERPSPARPAVVAIGCSAWYADPRHPGPSEPTVVSLVLRRRSATGADQTRLLARELRAELAAAERDAPGAHHRLRGEVERWVGHGFNPDDEHWVAWLGAPALALAGSTTPRAAVVHGAEDPVVPIEHGRRLAAALGVACTEVPGAGHHVGPALWPAVLDALGSFEIPDAGGGTGPVLQLTEPDRGRRARRGDG